MSDARILLEKQLEDPEFRAEWEALAPERAVIKLLYDERSLSDIVAATGLEEAVIKKIAADNELDIKE